MQTEVKGEEGFTLWTGDSDTAGVELSRAFFTLPCCSLRSHGSIFPSLCLRPSVRPVGTLPRKNIRVLFVPIPVLRAADLGVTRRNLPSLNSEKQPD